MLQRLSKHLRDGVSADPVVDGAGRQRPVADGGYGELDEIAGTEADMTTFALVPVNLFNTRSRAAEMEASVAHGAVPSQGTASSPAATYPY